jgi:hypothetical protein
VCEGDVMSDPSMLCVIRKVAALARVSPTLGLRFEESRRRTPWGGIGTVQDVVYY